MADIEICTNTIQARLFDFSLLQLSKIVKKKVLFIESILLKQHTCKELIDFLRVMVKFERLIILQARLFDFPLLQLSIIMAIYNGQQMSHQLQVRKVL